MALHGGRGILHFRLAKKGGEVNIPMVTSIRESNMRPKGGIFAPSMSNSEILIILSSIHQLRRSYTADTNVTYGGVRKFSLDIFPNLG